MMKRLGITALVLVVLNSICLAQFGGKLSGIGKKMSSAGALDTDGLVAQASAANNDFLVATFALANSYATMLDIADKNDEAAKLRDAVTHAKAEPVDKQAKFLVEPMNTAQRMLDAEAGNLQAKKLADKQKVDLARVSFNIAVAVLKDKAAAEKAGDLLPKTQNAITQVGSDPMGATKISKLQGAATALTGISTFAPPQVKAVAGITTTLAKMRKINNVADDKVAAATATSSFDDGEDVNHKGI